MLDVSLQGADDAKLLAEDSECTAEECALCHGGKSSLVAGSLAFLRGRERMPPGFTGDGPLHLVGLRGRDSGPRFLCLIISLDCTPCGSH